MVVRGSTNGLHPRRGFPRVSPDFEGRDLQIPTRRIQNAPQNLPARTWNTRAPTEMHAWHRPQRPLHTWNFGTLGCYVFRGYLRVFPGILGNASNRQQRKRISTGPKGVEGSSHSLSSLARSLLGSKGGSSSPPSCSSAWDSKSASSVEV